MKFENYIRYVINLLVQLIQHNYTDNYSRDDQSWIFKRQVQFLSFLIF